MRRILLILGFAAVASLSFGQRSGLFHLTSFGKALGEAKHLKAVYSIRPLDSVPREFTVELAKPNLAKIEWQDGIVVADGITITRFDKKNKTFFSKPQNEAGLRAIFDQDEMNLWQAFFNPTVYAKWPVAKSLGTRTRREIDFKVVEAQGDHTGKKTVTFYINPADNLAHQAEFTYSNGADKYITLVDTTSIVADDSMPDADTFSFKPPAQSRQITAAEMNTDKWYTNLEEALKVAGETNRMVFLDFYADW